MENTEPDLQQNWSGKRDERWGGYQANGCHLPRRRGGGEEEVRRRGGDERKRTGEKRREEKEEEQRSNHPC